MKARAVAFTVAAAVPVLGVTFAACVEPPPKIASIPPSGLSLRLHVFGAEAQDVQQAFNAAKENNKSFSIVREGGDGEVLIGLDNDSPACVQPTAFCSFKMAFRIRDNQGKVVQVSTTPASASSDKCAGLCEKALNAAVVKVIEASVVALKHGEIDGGQDTSEAGLIELDGGAPAASSAAPASKPPVKKGKGAKAEKPEPPMCSVGHGGKLPAAEAERRAAQVEALKRMSVLEPDEYDCLRKAYLERL